MGKLKALAALLAAGALLGLAACGKHEEKPPEQNSVAEEAPTADTEIGPNGAAGINSALPMTLEAVRAAAPLYIAGETDDQIDGAHFKAITLSLGDEEVFRLYPTADGLKLHAIATHSTQARSPDGEVIGTSLFRNAAPEGVVYCITDFDIIHEHGFSCSTGPDGKFWRTYRLPEGYDGPSGPFDAIDPDVAPESMLVEMKWTAPQ
jgi:hypothetical protein